MHGLRYSPPEPHCDSTIGGPHGLTPTASASGNALHVRTTMQVGLTGYAMLGPEEQGYVM
eukprot:IDg2716t1